MAKVDPYLRPLFDALHDMLEPERVSPHLERGVIEVAPLAFMRGRTLNDSFIILDEAQNTRPEQMKMFLTRLGFNSKMVVTGDITQIDLPREQDSGLVVVAEILNERRGDRVRPLRRARTSCATSWCGGSSPPTTSTSQRAGAELRPRKRATHGADRARRRGDRDRRRVAGGPDGGRGRGAVRARAVLGRDRRRATSRSSSSTRTGSASSTASTARSTSRPTCCRSASTRTAPAAGPRELGDIVICPEHTADLREAVVHGALHLTGHGSRDRRRRDARAPGRADALGPVSAAG